MFDKFDFQRKAREEALQEGFQTDFPPNVLQECNQPMTAAQQPCRDLRGLFWSSIDNPDSQDLDQAEWAEGLDDGRIRVLVAVADVAGVVHQGSATDTHAAANATSVYTGGPVFPMLPEILSTDRTSLRQNGDRPAVVVEFIVACDGKVEMSEVCTGLCRNHAKLSYPQVASWLSSPAAMPADPEIRRQLTLQAEASQRLRHFRKARGALVFGGQEAVPVVVDGGVRRMDIERENAARDIIESFMIAANIAMAEFLRGRKSPCLRRVVRSPKRWDRIISLAAEKGVRLPESPDARALGEFLANQKQNEPVHFPELSLAVLKSLGPGEYVVERPGTEHEGHFGLAADDYTHSTAPNRRYADLILQRLVKAVIDGGPAPYTEEDLAGLAAHCTEREAAARHVERFMKKVAAAVLLRPDTGKIFDGIVTGASGKGTFVRLLAVPAEGRVLRGERGMDVGQKVRVRLLGTDPERGFIDFAAA